MKPQVLDVSAVVAALVEGDDVLDEQCAWFAPAFLDVEFANVLWKRVRFAGHDGGWADEAWRAFVALGIEQVTDRDLLLEARRLAERTRLTVYDALYVELACRLSAELVTLDRDQAAAAAAESVAVRLVPV